MGLSLASTVQRVLAIGPAGKSLGPCISVNAPWLRRGEIATARDGLDDPHNNRCHAEHQRSVDRNNPRAKKSPSGTSFFSRHLPVLVDVLWEKKPNKEVVYSDPPLLQLVSNKRRKNNVQEHRE